MKKITKFVAGVLLAASLFVGCGKKTKLDENGFYMEVSSAFEAAQKKNQNVLVVVTMNGDDTLSSSFTENILTTSDFKNGIAKECAVLSIDFSEESFKKTVVSPEDSKKQQQEAEDFSALMQKNAQFASILGIQTTPSFYLMTKDEYMISELEFTNNMTTYSDFADLVNSYSSKVAEVNDYVTAINKSTGLEKVSAINALYEYTDVAYRPFLAKLIEEAVKLDKTNETGYMAKFIFANADTKAQNCYIEGNVEGAAQAYVDICSNQYLDSEYKQEAYYMAAYILSMSGSTEYEKIMGYLQSAIDADPESEGVEQIQEILNYIASTIQSYLSMEQ